jgi:hypothetical protein
MNSKGICREDSLRLQVGSFHAPTSLVLSVWSGRLDRISVGKDDVLCGHMGKCPRGNRDTFTLNLLFRQRLADSQNG